MMLDHAPSMCTFSRSKKRIGLIPGKKHSVPLITESNWAATDSLVHWIVQTKRWTIEDYHNVVFAGEFLRNVSSGVKGQNYRVAKVESAEG